MDRAPGGNHQTTPIEATVLRTEPWAVALRELERRSRDQETVLRVLAAQIAVAIQEQQAIRDLITVTLGFNLN